MTKPETVADVLAEMKLQSAIYNPEQWADRIERAMSASAEPVCIVFAWKGDTARFVEAEIDGASVSLPWHDRPDGLKELRIERIAHAPPASVPEWTDEQCVQFACVAFRHAPKNLPKGVTLQDIRMGAYRVMSATTPEPRT